MDEEKKSITNIMKKYGVEEDQFETTQMVQETARQSKEAELKLYATEFHAKNEFTQFLNDSYTKQTYTKNVEQEISAKMAQKAELRKQQQQQKDTQNRKKGNIAGIFGFISTVAATTFSYLSLRKLSSFPETNITVAVDSLNDAILMNTISVGFMVLSLIIFFYVIAKTKQASSWWLNFLCFVIIVTQTVILSGKYLIIEGHLYFL